ncbi:hypothetical protein IEQ34_021267 [Dendrobium chrysotoxum]|uniref:Uncharacterized protein n=1 Tax=Dendrobium chrysotoxum TaxID=161865 RepID=A0AAV7G497_DENCH|nr:hypothetical protein IEQ34_021267 [Dendrobium chrysotoxum]
MDVDDAPEVVDDISIPRMATKDLNQVQASRESRDVQTVAVGIEELNMDAYDDEDDVKISIWTHGGARYFPCNWSCRFLSAIGDTHYPSNDMDPYLQNKGVGKIACRVLLEISLINYNDE